MKTKTKNTPKAKNRIRSTSFSRKKVVQVHAKIPGLRRLKLVEHKHTLKLIHHRHTSHLVLLGILIIVGFFLYASNNLVQATTSGQVVVGATVHGSPPSVGAVIVSPQNGATFKDQTIINVYGTCYNDSFVVIRDNNIQVGSAACTHSGIFSLQVQLELGNNKLSALNYDNLNQAGPATPSVTVTVTESEPVTPTTPTIVIPTIPINPSIISGLPSGSSFSSCDDYSPSKVTTGGPLHISVVCVPRLFSPNTQQTMGILIWGGTPPYALYVNFGNNGNNTTLISIKEPGYHKIQLAYAVPDTYKIQFRLADQKNQTAIVQTAVQVNGQKQSTVSSIMSDLTKEIFGDKPWYESPVPFYLLAVAITLGFWGGDIFDRKYGAGHHRTRKKATT